MQVKEKTFSKLNIFINNRSFVARFSSLIFCVGKTNFVFEYLFLLQVSNSPANFYLLILIQICLFM